MKTCIIALEYLEPEYQATLDCLKKVKLKYPVFTADRKGYLGIPKAFNDAFKKIQGYDYVWFITNITFAPDAVEKLEASIGDYAAICPVYDSDHPHLRPKQHGGIEEIPFVEFTCPFVRADVFKNQLLDENLPYYYHDLVWSFHVKQKGNRLAVNNDIEVGHVYLRNSRSMHPISIKRKKLRQQTTPGCQRYMKTKYGKDWTRLMQWKP